MEFLKTNLLEEPFAFCMILIVIGMSSLVIASKRRTRPWIIGGLAPLALAGVVALTAWLVVTDREKIQQTLASIAADVKAGRLDNLGDYVDDSYADGRNNRQQLVDRARQALRSITIESMKLSNMAVQTDTLPATATFKAQARVVHPMAGTADVPTNWKVDWVKKGDRWRISRVQLVAVMPMLADEMRFP